MKLKMETTINIFSFCNYHEASVVVIGITTVIGIQDGPKYVCELLFRVTVNYHIFH